MTDAASLFVRMHLSTLIRYKRMSCIILYIIIVLCNMKSKHVLLCNSLQHFKYLATQSDEIVRKPHSESVVTEVN